MVIYLTYYQVMIKINTAEVKIHFSRYVKRVERGETIIVCRRNVPIAEIRPIPKPPLKQRPVGIDRGMTLPSSFFEPLPDELLDEFEGTKELP